MEVWIVRWDWLLFYWCFCLHQLVAPHAQIQVLHFQLTDGSWRVVEIQNLWGELISPPEIVYWHQIGHPYQLDGCRVFLFNVYRGQLVSTIKAHVLMQSGSRYMQEVTSLHFKQFLLPLIPIVFHWWWMEFSCGTDCDKLLHTIPDLGHSILYQLLNWHFVNGCFCNICMLLFCCIYTCM